MSCKPGLKTKIEYAGLSEKVIDMLFVQKLSYEKICEILKAEHDIELTPGSISLFKNNVLKTVPEFLSKDEAYREKLAKQYLDTVENLSFAIQKIKEKIELFEDPSKWKQQTTYLTLMLHELHLLLRRAGEIKPTQFIEKQENVTNIQINMMVQMEIVRMIDTGEISLEHCSDPIKQFYRKMKGNANFA